MDERLVAPGCGYEIRDGKLVRASPLPEDGAASGEPPPVDARLVVEGCGYEVFEGNLVDRPPSSELRANRRARLALLLEAHVADGFTATLDMLTRTSEVTDIAPDASVYPRARDPRTAGRRLEHLAFEIVDAGLIEYAGRKAASLAARGVRRVFAIDVECERVLEWARDLARWCVLGAEAAIADPALAVPLPVEVLLHEDKVDAALVRALLARRNPVLEAATREALARAECRAQGRAEGFAEGISRAILAVLIARGLRLSTDEQEQILRERDPARLKRWLGRVAACASAAELLAIR